MSKKLVVTDFSVGEIHIFNYDVRNSEEEEEVLDFLDQYHNNQGGSFKLYQISWMIVNLFSKGELPIYIH